MISVISLMIQFLILSLINSTVKNIPTVLIIAFIFIQSIAIIYDIRRNSLLGEFPFPIFLGYILRLFFVFFDIYGKNIYALPNSGSDSEMYYEGAVSFITTGDVGRGGVFSTIMGIIFSFIGTSRLYGQYLVMLFSIVSICFLPVIMDKFDVDSRIKYGTVTLISLLPNFAIISSVFLRESLVTMLITISIYFFTSWIVNGRGYNFVLAIILAFMSAALHSGSISLVIGYIVVRLIYDSSEKKIHIKVSNIIISIFFVVVFVFLYLNYGEIFFRKMVNVDSLSDISSVSTGGSSYARFVGNSDSVLNMFIYTIPRIIYFLFSPFPWQWRGFSDIIAFLFSSCFYLITIIKAVKYIRHSYAKNREIVIILLIVTFCMVFVFAWGVSNTGTAVRHRDKMVILFGIIYGLANNMDINKRKRIMFGDRRIL